jgi:nucleotide-binding universal stress UspA family protein
VGAAQAARELRHHRMEVSRERLRETLDTFNEQCGAAAVRYRVQHETSEPFTLMADLARYHDVMIFGLRSVFDCGLGVDAQDVLVRLVRGGVRPILAVSREYRDVRRALLAYSGSAESAKAVKRFVQSRLWPDVRLRLLTCARSEGDAEPLLTDMASYCRAHGSDPEMEYRQSPARSGILAAAAEWDADLIVLGSGARHLWLHRILGGTAGHVIQHADRPLYLSH